MSEIKPVYQARMLFENMFCECEEDQFAKLKELDNCETRILYPAAAYEAQAKRIAELENVKQAAENLVNCKGRYHAEQNMIALANALAASKNGDSK